MDLKLLFQAQIQDLKDHACPADIIQMFADCQDSVVAKAAKMPVGNGRYPFLPVISQNLLGWDELMKMVGHQTKDGKGKDAVVDGYVPNPPTIWPAKIRDVSPKPNRPYFIFDVEDGTATLNQSPDDAVAILDQRARSPLTIAETISLCLHTNVLHRHPVWAGGSIYGDGARATPYVAIALGDRPTLLWGFSRERYDGWGVASCGT